MKYVDIESLIERRGEIRSSFQGKRPFRYTVIENFFKEERAEEIYNAYPKVEDGKWDGITYLDQKNKFQKAKFEPSEYLHDVFEELNSEALLKWLNEVSEIELPLQADPDLFGGGLHQSVNGAFLNVHVDYNIHPKTKYHRRLNVIVYMNKEWKDEYEGHLELWDLTGDNQVLLEKVAPTFNRCVIFETNEISFHGHPKKLNTPEGINRKSLALYYYTSDRPENEKVASHNTIYKNTEGVSGSVKRFNSGVKAFLERINKKK